MAIVRMKVGKTEWARFISRSTASGMTTSLKSVARMPCLEILLKVFHPVVEADTATTEFPQESRLVYPCNSCCLTQGDVFAGVQADGHLEAKPFRSNRQTLQLVVLDFNIHRGTLAWCRADHNQRVRSAQAIETSARTPCL